MDEVKLDEVELGYDIPDSANVHASQPSALCYKDQVIAVPPVFPHNDFLEYQRELTVSEMRPPNLSMSDGEQEENIEDFALHDMNCFDAPARAGRSEKISVQSLVELPPESSADRDAYQEEGEEDSEDDVRDG
ncbi:unnamed protein product [Zymoseptoria tritici ST99CH_3D1]|nr:unnamed protein product [Zymoseptoria tritici ST99CH_3D1]